MVSQYVVSGPHGSSFVADLHELTFFDNDGVFGGNAADGFGLAGDSSEGWHATCHVRLLLELGMVVDAGNRSLCCTRAHDIGKILVRRQFAIQWRSCLLEPFVFWIIRRLYNTY